MGKQRESQGNQRGLNTTGAALFSLWCVFVFYLNLLRKCPRPCFTVLYWIRCFKFSDWTLMRAVSGSSTIKRQMWTAFMRVKWEQKSSSYLLCEESYSVFWSGVGMSTFSCENIKYLTVSFKWSFVVSRVSLDTDAKVHILTGFDVSETWLFFCSSFVQYRFDFSSSWSDQILKKIQCTSKIKQTCLTSQAGCIPQLQTDYIKHFCFFIKTFFPKKWKKMKK